jgi:hypothetical protein
VAVLSPSAGLPELFPLPFETGLQRIRDDFGLMPVEYPTTRRMGGVNLLAYLWNLGIVAYHGGSVMCQFGRCGQMHPLRADSLRAALFTSGEFEPRQSFEYCDIDNCRDLSGHGPFAGEQ